MDALFEDPAMIVKTLGGAAVVAFAFWRVQAAKVQQAAAVKTKSAAGSGFEVSTAAAAPKAKKADKKKAKKSKAKATAAEEPAAPPAKKAEPAPAKAAPAKKEAATPAESKKAKEAEKKKAKKAAKKAKAAAPPPPPVEESSDSEPEEPKPMTKEQKQKAKKAARKAKKQAAAIAAATGGAADADANSAGEVEVEDEWTLVSSSYAKNAEKKAAKAAEASEKTTKEEDGSVTIDVGEALSQVIGRAGVTIKQITADSGAKIDTERGTTICKISGSPGAVEKAVEMVQAVVDKFNDDIANMSRVVVTVGEKAPAIIGKGGSVIKSIQAESGAKLDVSCEAGTVTISGGQEEVAAAQELVRIAIHGEAQQAIELGQRGVYLILGTSGSTIRRLQDETGARFDIGGQGVSKTLCTIIGSKDAVAKATVLVQKILMENSFEIEINVDEGDIGAVVGKGGTYIRKVEQDTSAKLEVDRDACPGVVTLRIIGTQAQVYAAKAAIDRRLAGEPDLLPGEVAETIDLGNAVRSVIGARGATVKQMQEETGAKIDIVRGTSICKVYGKPDAVAAAKAKVEEKISVQLEREAKVAAAAAALNQEVVTGEWTTAAPPAGFEGSWAPVDHEMEGWVAAVPGPNDGAAGGGGWVKAAAPAGW